MTAMVCLSWSVISIVVTVFVAEMRLRSNNEVAEEKRRNAGVLWSGDHLFEGTVETIEMLKKQGMLSDALHYILYKGS